MTRIACPSDCQYLDSSSGYQQKRSGERFAQARKDFYKDLFVLGDDKAAALFNFIETITFGYFCNRKDGQDAEVITAIQSLRRNLSPLHIPAVMAPVFAEHLKKQYEIFSKQKDQPVPDTTLATEVLDRAMKFVTEFSGGGLQSSRFLNGLIGYIRAYHPQVAEQLAKQQEGGRIVLPGQFTPQPSSHTQHTHGPDCGHHHH
ncbi:MAG TPA: hypothetical protein VES96_06340 [Nitrospiraceae bacterium]|nr:hypothetical protein [Nitrospiraceae bacterium]